MNYYWIGYRNDKEKQTIHYRIGKLISGGSYCIPCGIALVHGGSRYIHSKEPFLSSPYMMCPNCNRYSHECETTDLFFWTMMKHNYDIYYNFNNFKDEQKDTRKIIIDDNDTMYTIEEFLIELKNVYIQHQAILT